MRETYLGAFLRGVRRGLEKQRRAAAGLKPVAEPKPRPEPVEDEDFTLSTLSQVAAEPTPPRPMPVPMEQRRVAPPLPEPAPRCRRVGCEKRGADGWCEEHIPDPPSRREPARLYVSSLAPPPRGLKLPNQKELTGE